MVYCETKPHLIVGSHHVEKAQTSCLLGLHFNWQLQCIVTAKNSYNAITMQVAKELAIEAGSSLTKKEYDEFGGLVRNSDATKLRCVCGRCLTS